MRSPISKWYGIVFIFKNLYFYKLHQGDCRLPSAQIFACRSISQHRLQSRERRQPTPSQELSISQPPVNQSNDLHTKKNVIITNNPSSCSSSSSNISRSNDRTINTGRQSKKLCSSRNTHQHHQPTAITTTSTTTTTILQTAHTTLWHRWNICQCISMFFNPELSITYNFSFPPPQSQYAPQLTHKQQTHSTPQQQRHPL